jgi:hypothetical protein
MPTKIAGGCACGAIRYEVSADPIVMFNCHCRDCQKTTGSGYTPVFYAPANAFKITKGTPKYHETKSEMIGDNTRGFCSECGSRLFGARPTSARGSRVERWTIQASTNRNSKCGLWTHSRGTTWIPNCRSSRNTDLRNERIDRKQTRA